MLVPFLNEKNIFEKIVHARDSLKKIAKSLHLQPIQYTYLARRGLVTSNRHTVIGRVQRYLTNHFRELIWSTANASRFIYLKFPKFPNSWQIPLTVDLFSARLYLYQLWKHKIQWLKVTMSLQRAAKKNCKGGVKWPKKKEEEKKLGGLFTTFNLL